MAHQLRVQAQTTWSNISETQVNLEKLRLLCSHEKALRHEGYVTKPLAPSVVLSKLRCQNCGNRMEPPGQIPASTSTKGNGCTGKATRDMGQHPSRKTLNRDLCEHHPGRVINLHFTCCQAHVSIQKGCHINPAHTAPVGYMQELQLNWTYTTTPTSSQPLSGPTKRSRARARFTNTAATAARSAIALDCEFGVSVLNEPELIRMTAIDFFTRQVLVDSLVKPNVIIKNYVTRYSGVTSADMRNAVRNQTCIFGRDAAREELLRFVNTDTIMIMHGGSSDMSTLRWIHPNILDTHILETYFELLPGGRSLKNLCEKKLDIKIQTGRGHDSREDALACRELAIWVMNILPDA